MYVCVCVCVCEWMYGCGASEWVRCDMSFVDITVCDALWDASAEIEMR